MSVETDKIPPVPEHTPPLREDAISGNLGKYFSQPWTRWFVSLRDKINVIDTSLVNLANVSGNGLVSKNGSSWVARVLEGVANRTSVTNGNGASGNPTVDVVTADLVAGTNVTFTGSGTGRIIGNSNLTINASGGGGGGGFTQISRIITASSQPTVTFPSISNTYTNLLILILGRGTASVTDVEGRIRFNGDSGNNYNAIRENRFGNSNVALTSYMSGFSIPAASSPTDATSPVRIDIPGYYDSTKNKASLVNSTIMLNNTAAGLFGQWGGGFWLNTSPITQIDIYLSSGNWADGSIVTLYGLS